MTSWLLNSNTDGYKVDSYRLYLEHHTDSTQQRAEVLRSCQRNALLISLAGYPRSDELVFARNRLASRLRT